MMDKDYSKLSSTELMQAIINRMKEAEERMVQQFHEDLYSGNYYSGPMSEELRAELDADIRYRKSLKYRFIVVPYKWLMIRIRGTFRLWKSGECGECEPVDDYY